MLAERSGMDYEPATVAASFEGAGLQPRRWRQPQPVALATEGMAEG